MDWLLTIGIALCIGAPLGMSIMSFIVAATRCEGCCQKENT